MSIPQSLSEVVFLVLVWGRAETSKNSFPIYFHYFCQKSLTKVCFLIFSLLLLEIIENLQESNCFILSGFRWASPKVSQKFVFFVFLCLGKGWDLKEVGFLYMSITFDRNRWKTSFPAHVHYVCQKSLTICKKTTVFHTFRISVGIPQSLSEVFVFCFFFGLGKGWDLKKVCFPSYVHYVCQKS
jgi:hypothetical protein